MIAAGDERRRRDLGNRVGGHDRARDVTARARRHREPGGADAAHHAIHRHRTADHAGAAHEHIDGIEVEHVAGGGAHHQRVAKPLRARARVGVARVDDDRGDGRAAAECQLRDHHGSRLDRVAREDAGSDGGSVRPDDRDVGARLVAVEADARGSDAARNPSGAQTPDARLMLDLGAVMATATRVSSPAVSSNPKRTFNACTAWPAPPLPRLSMATVITATPSCQPTWIAARLVPVTLLVGGGLATRSRNGLVAQKSA